MQCHGCKTKDLTDTKPLHFLWWLMKNKGDVFEVRHGFWFGFLAQTPFFSKLPHSTIRLLQTWRTNRSAFPTLQYSLQKPKLYGKHWYRTRPYFYSKQTAWRMKFNCYTCSNDSSNGCYLLLCKKKYLLFLVCYYLLKLHSMQEKDTFFFSNIMINPVKNQGGLLLKFHIKWKVYCLLIQPEAHLPHH